MDALANERICYFNGDYIPESQALVPYRDRSFLFGDGAFDMTRTFAHEIFRLEDHIERYYRSLKALRLDPGLSPKEMIDISHKVFDKNRHLLGEGDDFWLGQRVSRGVMKVEGDNWDNYGPAVIVECLPMPLAERAHYFRDGVPIVVPSVRRTSPDSVPPRAKTHNYLNLVLGDLEVKAQNPKGWAILLDCNGNLSEGLGSNLFVIRDGVLLTPQERYVLPGISRLTAMELAQQLGYRVEERDIDLFDAYNADEAFITSTSLCICPVTSVNGVTIGEGQVYGPITQQLIDAYRDMVGCDFVAQHLAKLSDG